MHIVDLSAPEPENQLGVDQLVIAHDVGHCEVILLGLLIVDLARVLDDPHVSLAHITTGPVVTPVAFAFLGRINLMLVFALGFLVLGAHFLSDLHIEVKVLNNGLHLPDNFSLGYYLLGFSLGVFSLSSGRHSERDLCSRQVLIATLLYNLLLEHVDASIVEHGYELVWLWICRFHLPLRISTRCNPRSRLLAIADLLQGRRMRGSFDPPHDFNSPFLLDISAGIRIKLQDLVRGELDWVEDKDCTLARAHECLEPERRFLQEGVAFNILELRVARLDLLLVDVGVDGHERHPHVHVFRVQLAGLLV